MHDGIPHINVFFHSCLALGAADFRREDVLRYAASAEAPSEHPVARAVVTCAEEEEVTLSEAEHFQASAGGGVEALVSGHPVVIGTPTLLADRGIAVRDAERVLTHEEARGRTAVLLAVDHELAGMLSIADTVKPDARQAVAELKALGMQVVMLTGDADRTARAVAAEVGIEGVRSRVLPGQKADRVRELQGGDGRVAFVGDGINDAPALMQADVGIAIAAGTDIAIESSDVILIGERLSAVVDAYHIGRKSCAKTVQNLIFAFSFNAVGIPLAATGLVHPVWAMVAMAASVSAVLLNSFGGRLLPGRPSPEQVAETAARRHEVSPAEARADVHAMEHTPPGEPGHVVLDVPDMHCAGCEQSIKRRLGTRDGIDEVSARAGEHKVRVAYRPDRIGVHEIEEAVTSLGFRVQAVHATGHEPRTA